MAMRAVTGKRLQIARWLLRTGFGTPLLRRRRPSLVVFNYHRLWPSKGAVSEFDDGVFGPDVEEFRRQMQWLSAATNVLDEEGLLAVASGDCGHFTKPLSAVTFDDAYVDCYSLAKPVLEESGIRGIFFAPVDMIDTRQLGWWDLAAYLLKRTEKPTVVLGNDVLNAKREFTSSLRRILNLFKLRPTEETDGLLAELSRACDVPLPGRDAQSDQLMTWDQLRAMRRNGHGVGSHTFSHRVLATLSPEAQAREIHESRRELAARISRDVISFAYPVGGPQHINKKSIDLVREAGYSQAFTFNTGISDLPIADRFRIPRESAHSFDALRAKTLMPGLMGLREKRAV
jgi:peptidoglycan/xylan/chitin deacetylase (PgdA/CDA1 family)